jgi:uncharacterized phiE125 gp8 family phage protein
VFGNRKAKQASVDVCCPNADCPLPNAKMIPPQVFLPPVAVCAGLSLHGDGPAFFLKFSIQLWSAYMALVLTSGPAVEPVSVADAKTHLRIDGTAEDILIASLLLTSRLHIETALGLALINQSWMLVLDRWPQCGTVEIPIAPLQAVTAVRVRNAAGVATTVPPTSYLVDIASKPPRLIWNNNWAPSSPGQVANGIEIDVTAGFGAMAASVPAPLKHAILLLSAHWYEHRDPVEIGSTTARIPEAVADLIQPFRKFRL